MLLIAGVLKDRSPRFHSRDIPRKAQGSRFHHVLESYLPSIIHVESSGNPRAVSPKGAKGLMQLMPIIQYHYQVKDPFNPIENIKGGYRFLLDLYDKYHGDLSLTFAAYNTGESNLDRAIYRAKSRDWNKVSKHLPSETQVYVRRIYETKNRIESKE